jgi:hypothetical protein
MCGGEVRVELLTDLRHLFAGKPAAGGQFGDLLEVVVLSGRAGSSPSHTGHALGLRTTRMQVVEFDTELVQTA